MPELSKQIILKSFEGRVTPLQQTLIAEWLNQPANVEQYFEWLEEWERANPQFLPNIDRGYERSLERSQPQTEPVIIAMPRLTWRPWLLAASVALALLVGSGWLLRDALHYKQHQTTFGEVSALTLPDGSRVVLNANTRLRVPRWNFGTGTREVWLTGEAEFSVQHLTGHQPFVVHTSDGLNVRVLGTEFVVYSRLRGSKVVLNKGSVQLKSDRNALAKPLTIRPGDVATFSAPGHFTLRHRQPVALHTAWKDHRFTFENTPLAEITYRIAEQFGVMVEIPDTTLGMRLAKRKSKLIHRIPLSANLGMGGSTNVETEQLTRRAMERLDFLDGPIWAEIKFNWSHAYSSPKLVKVHGGKLNDTYFNPAPANYKIAWMARNEDFFCLRWGVPSFIREHIATNTPAYVGGYFVGSECYIPAADYFTKPGPAVDWTYAFERQ